PVDEDDAEGNERGEPADDGAVQQGPEGGGPEQLLDEVEEQGPGHEGGASAHPLVVDEGGAARRSVDQVAVPQISGHCHIAFPPGTLGVTPEGNALRTPSKASTA